MASVTPATTSGTAPSSTPRPPISRHSSTAIVPQSPVDDAQTSAAPSLRPSLSWKSIRSSISVSERTSAQLGWAVAFLSVLLTIVTLSPAFKSQILSEKAYKLAEWTALKDYIEECREELAAGIQSQACVRAMNAKLPPPPYVRPGVLDKIRRGMLVEQHEGNLTSMASQLEYSEVHLPKAIQGLVFLAIVLPACVFLFLSFESTRSSVMHWSNIRSDKKDEDLVLPLDPPIPENEIPPITSSIIRHPPSPSDATLRRRPIRNHPIYRHANLEEAIHEEDMAEIRTRLQNGEDVNEHWPYLIYSLAITPPTAITASRLEIARLCLDFGADVNALKGWNGQSALMIAIHFGNVDVARLLIVNGATVCYSPPDSNLTALHRCVRLAVTGSAADALFIMNLLFQYGADANQADRTNETPLHKLLIDAWLSRDDRVAIERLEPIALCLLRYGARMPKFMKEKYILGNPLWEVVKRERREIERMEWAKRTAMG